jgi:hypothetical protein
MEAGLVPGAWFEERSAKWDLVVSTTHFRTRVSILLAPRLIGVVIMLQTSIWEVLSSHISQDTGCPNWGLSWLSSAPSGKCWDSTTDQAMTASFQILSNSLCTSHPIVQHYTVWDADSVINLAKKSDLCRALSELTFYVDVWKRSHCRNKYSEMSYYILRFLFQNFDILKFWEPSIQLQQKKNSHDAADYATNASRDWWISNHCSWCFQVPRIVE